MSVKQAYEVLQGLYDLMCNKQYEELDAILASIVDDVQTVTVLTMVAHLRFTFTIRDRLPQWKVLLYTVREELDRRAQYDDTINSDRILKGLL